MIIRCVLSLADCEEEALSLASQHMYKMGGERVNCSSILFLLVCDNRYDRGCAISCRKVNRYLHVARLAAVRALLRFTQFYLHHSFWLI